MSLDLRLLKSVMAGHVSTRRAMGKDVVTITTVRVTRARTGSVLLLVMDARSQALSTISIALVGSVWTSAIMEKHAVTIMTVRVERKKGYCQAINNCPCGVSWC